MEGRRELPKKTTKKPPTLPPLSLVFNYFLIDQNQNWTNYYLSSPKWIKCLLLFQASFYKDRTLHLAESYKICLFETANPLKVIWHFKCFKSLTFASRNVSSTQQPSYAMHRNMLTRTQRVGLLIVVSRVLIFIK